MRGGWEIEGRSSGRRSVTVDQPYLLDVDKLTDRLTRFQSTCQEKVSLIDGQRWRYRPFVMLPGIKGGGSVFFDVVLALGDKLDLITVTAPPIVDAAVMADAQAEFLLSLGIRIARSYRSSSGRRSETRRLSNIGEKNAASRSDLPSRSGHQPRQT
jgi:hypothetical protein